MNRHLKYYHLTSLVLIYGILLFFCLAAIAWGNNQPATLTDVNDQYLSLDYHALVVGVSNYNKWPVLPNTAMDARQVASLLRRAGMKVLLLIDPNSKELKAALKDFVYITGKEKNRSILFYYAGHGETRIMADGTRTGWIIPKDCPLLRSNAKEFGDKAISSRTLETYSIQMRARHVLMLFDTSFSGEMFAQKTPVLGLLNQESWLPVRQYIIAGRADEPIPDRSMFKKFLLEGLKGAADVIHDGLITGSELGNYLSQRVIISSGGSRHPLYGKINNSAFDKGDFVLRKITTQKQRGRLIILSNPKNYQVRVLNIRPRYIKGMELKPGRYHLEVSAHGYKPVKKWIRLEPDKDNIFNIKLEKVAQLMSNSLGMQFIYIPPGAFLMGSPANDKKADDDESGHRVSFKNGFRLQTTEVTVGQFRHFIKDSGYKTSAEKAGGCYVKKKFGGWKKKPGSFWDKPGSWDTDNKKQTDNFPVTCVSWTDATAFIKWLGKKEEQVYRLPTEAEWEYACRAGSKASFGFGRCLSTAQANYGKPGVLFSDCKSKFKTKRHYPLKAGSLKKNFWGLYDMHGNVAEWCMDWYGPYPKGATTSPSGPDRGAERVIRGGHYYSSLDECRSAKRSRFEPDLASDVIGFRLLLPVP